MHLSRNEAGVRFSTEITKEREREGSARSSSHVRDERHDAELKQQRWGRASSSREGLLEC
jgi:hypothetical protein